MILLCNDMRIIRYQLKLRVYTQEVMLINSTVFAVERLTKFITNRRFSFASLFLRAVSDGNVMQEGTIAEITITTADGRKYETNLKLTANDLQLFDDVRQIMK